MRNQSSVIFRVRVCVCWGRGVSYVGMRVAAAATRVHASTNRPRPLVRTPSGDRTPRTRRVVGARPPTHHTLHAHPYTSYAPAPTPMLSDRSTLNAPGELPPPTFRMLLFGVECPFPFPPLASLLACSCGACVCVQQRSRSSARRESLHHHRHHSSSIQIHTIE